MQDNSPIKERKGGARRPPKYYITLPLDHILNVTVSLPCLKALCARFSGGGRRIAFELVRGPDGLDRGVDDETDKSGPEDGPVVSLAGELKVVGGLFRLLRMG